MNFTNDLLDAAKVSLAISSDYRLAQLLGVERQTVSNYRAGRTFPSPSTTYDLAKMAGSSPTEAVIGVGIDRAQDGKDSQVWQSLRAEFQALARHECRPSA